MCACAPLHTRVICVSPEIHVHVCGPVHIRVICVSPEIRMHVRVDLCMCM